MNRAPNFFIVGAGKAGTTSLHTYLAQHPAIYMSPVKEPCYFADEIRPKAFTRQIQDHIRLQSKSLPKHVHDGLPFDRTGWIASNWEDYLRLFQEVTTETVIGESSAAYLWSATAAANIHARVPDARIVMMLRDPAERAFSQYLHQVAIGLTRHSFREHLDRCASDRHKELGIYYPFLEAGLYHDQVSRFLNVFPRERIRIFWYETDWNQPDRLLRELFAFLQVDPVFMPDTARKSHERRAPRWVTASYFLRKLRIWQGLRAVVPEPIRPGLRRLAFRTGQTLRMEARDRQFLIDYYRDDILRLQQLLNRDLSGWLR